MALAEGVTKFELCELSRVRLGGLRGNGSTKTYSPLKLGS